MKNGGSQELGPKPEIRGPNEIRNLKSEMVWFRAASAGRAPGGSRASEVERRRQGTGAGCRQASSLRPGWSCPFPHTNHHDDILGGKEGSSSGGCYEIKMVTP